MLYDIKKPRRHHLGGVYLVAVIDASMLIELEMIRELSSTLDIPRRPFLGTFAAYQADLFSSDRVSELLRACVISRLALFT